MVRTTPFLSMILILLYIIKDIKIEISKWKLLPTISYNHTSQLGKKICDNKIVKENFFLFSFKIKKRVLSFNQRKETLKLFKKCFPVK